MLSNTLRKYDKRMNNKTAGLRPAPHPLFEKSGAKTSTENAQGAFSGKVLMKLFQKFPGARGQSP
jgi:hypothetical protein